MSEPRALSSVLPTSSPSAGVGLARNAIEERRRVLFRETPFELCERVVLGTAWALRPKRIRALLRLARVWLRDLVMGNRRLPDAATLGGDVELAGIAHDLSEPVLLEAYQRGLFPHGHVGRPKWFSPKERAVLLLDEFHISTRLRSIMRQGKYCVTFDCDFEGVIKACAGRRPGRPHLTWITPRIMRAYAKLYDDRYVHSFEVWNAQGELVGGGYGVAMGRVFVIESQFFRESNASKIGFSVLAWHLARWGFALCDNKWLTSTTAQMGFRVIPRGDYLRRIAAAMDEPLRRGRWEPEAGTSAVADWRPSEKLEMAAAG